MDKIHYLPTEGTTGFWGLRDVPEEPTGSNYHAFGYASFEWKTFGYEVEIEKYNATLESCKSNKLEIVNPEVFSYPEKDKIVLFSEFAERILKPGDLFDIASNYEFKEEEFLYCDNAFRSKKVVRLIKI